MYLNLGQEAIENSSIIGIFDLDTATVAEKTRTFLRRAEESGAAVTLSFEDLPRSFIVAQREAEERQTVYISPLSAATLLKRTEEFYV